jgi:hypothetical protein
MATVTEVFPEFARELEQLTASSERPELARDVASLSIVDRCKCGQANCAHFYTAPPPAGSYGPAHSNVMLDADSGLVVLDVVGDTIVAVEVLDRPDVKRRLDLLIPIDAT